MVEGRAPGRRRPVKTPTIIQMEAVECGAAALGIILAHYHHYRPLELLRQDCGVNRDGSNAGSMVKVAKSFGLDAAGKKVEIDELNDVPLPAILFWNFNHFVVLEGYSGDVFYLNDPSVGRRTVDYEAFNKAFTGIVLSMVPGEKFEKTGGPPGLLEGLRSRFNGVKSGLSFAVIAGLFLVIPGVLFPGFLKVFIDDVLLDGREDWLRPLLWGMGIAAVVHGLLSWLQTYVLLRSNTKLAVSMSSKFLNHLLRLPTNFFQQRLPGDIASRVQSNDTVAGLLSNQLASSCIGLLMIVFYAVVMLTYDVSLTLVGILVVVVIVLVVRSFTRIRVDESRRLQQEIGKQYGVMMSGLQTIDALKASGREGDFFARWAGHQAVSANSQQRLSVMSTWLGLAPSLMQKLLLNAVVLGWGGMQVIQGELSIGSLIAMQFLMSSFIGPAMTLVGLGEAIQTIQADIARLDDIQKCDIDELVVLDQDSESSDQGGYRRLSGAVEFKDVTFGYDHFNPPLIDKLSFVLRPGGRIAIVGKTGSGKSTVAKLLAGLYHPWNGAVLFDGVSLVDVPRAVRSASVSMVNQDIVLFEGTVRQNLSLWDDSIPDVDLVRCARDAKIFEPIAERSGGLNGNLAAMGNNFSGGQQQRLEIARALATNPSVLILDEATSALDAETEQQIDMNLRERGCSSVIVAHRLSTIRDADEIIVLDGGKVVERGTHDELMGLHGHYESLVTAV